MSPQPQRASPRWLSCLDLACAALAGALWYLFPQVGAWPLVVALLPWMVRLVWTGHLSRRTPLTLPVGIFVCTAGLGVWAAYDRPVAWRKFWLIVGAVLIFYALANAQPLGHARSWLLAAFGAGVALYFLASHDWQAFPAKVPALARLGHTLQAPLPPWPSHRMNPNVAAGILAMTLPFAGLVTLQVWRPRGQAGQAGQAWLARLAALCLLALILLGLVMAVSRAAWLAVAVALLLAGLWLAAGRLGGATTISRTGAFAVLLGVGVMFLLALGLVWPQTMVSALTSLPGDNAASGRLDLLRRSATLLGDYPLIGAGLGGFQMLYSTYALLVHVGYAPHSHNLFLDVALEQGLPGLLALVSMGLLFAWTVWRASPELGDQPADQGERGVQAAATLSLGMVLLHGLADDPLYSGRGVLLIFVPLAFGAYVPREQPSRWRQLALPAGLLVILVLAFLGRSPLLSLVFSNLGAVHQGQAELSVYRWPEWPIQDEVRRLANLDRARLEFERALAFNPRNGTAHRRLGMIDLAQGRYPDALRHLEAARSAGSHDQATRQLLGEAYLANGRLAEGRALWSGASNDQGQLDLRVAWYRHLGDARRAAWMHQAISRQP